MLWGPQTRVAEQASNNWRAETPESSREDRHRPCAWRVERPQPEPAGQISLYANRAITGSGMQVPTPHRAKDTEPFGHSAAAITDIVNHKSLITSIHGRIIAGQRERIAAQKFHAIREAQTPYAFPSRSIASEKSTPVTRRRRRPTRGDFTLRAPVPQPVSM